MVFWGYILLSSRKTPGRVGSSVIDRGEENRLKRLTAASTPLRGGGVWLPLHGAMVGSDSLAG
ncbi:MAG: hypothetical protein P5683_04385 [Limnospira sp. PMC 1279.21]|uniref:Uncharacterized protein n=1 Tax=Limnospira fusiformis PMC 851.14 TaxID=2219512 RepID=A0ABU9ELK8_LIMFS|nr:MULTISPECIES: hypothetical protein [Limnospira]MDT9192116.1 hypothetical protein [Limnospira sp. PMC 1245.20]MDT9207431.1 hypothetical protein [Limnospira sp. PMC 1252.20]MDT9222865.1 hypothetical protein [Limnospira sp. PMC 1279.21]MDT9235425.1 hypothetical protein [Limnospira sp. PMC 917.15]MDT9238167.1 hypothetical protein [Limnospira sp. PMC 1261.20]